MGLLGCMPQPLSSLGKSHSTVKVKWSRYRPSVAQRVGRVIAPLFHDHDTRRRWVVSSTPRPHFTPGKDPVPILRKAGWAPGPVCMGGKSHPHRHPIPDRPACSQSLYWLSYPTHPQYCGAKKTFCPCQKSNADSSHYLKSKWYGG